MQIVFMGTSGSWPTPLRNTTAIAIKRGPEVILFDCGEGSQRQFMNSALSFMQISKIFITHFHGDHFLGLPGLIQSMSLNDRDRPLQIFGPGGIQELVKSLLTLGYFAPGFDIHVGVMESGSSIDFGEYTISSLEVKHTVPALAYSLTERQRPGRFDKQKALDLGVPEGPLFGQLQVGHDVVLGERTITPDMVMGPPRRGRKIVYSGDTLPIPELVGFSQNCDVLIHDATAESSMEVKANKYGHSTAKQAAVIAKDCSASTLILTHFSPRYEDIAPMLAEAKEVFENTIIAEDFMEHNVAYTD